jgi:hypothetical protein
METEKSLLTEIFRRFFAAGYMIGYPEQYRKDRLIELAELQSRAPKGFRRQRNLGFPPQGRSFRRLLVKGRIPRRSSGLRIYI